MQRVFQYGEGSPKCGVSYHFFLAPIASMGCETREEQVEALKDTDVTSEDIDINEISSKLSIRILPWIYTILTTSLPDSRERTIVFMRTMYALEAEALKNPWRSLLPRAKGIKKIITPVPSIPCVILNALIEGREVKWIVEGTVLFDTPTELLSRHSLKRSKKKAEDNILLYYGSSALPVTGAGKYQFIVFA